MDIVKTYAESLGFRATRKIILVEGTTDADLFNRATRLEREATGAILLGDEVCIVAAGEGESGGTHGVLQQLTTFRSLTRLSLGQDGKPMYRVAALFDNDRAGQQAVKAARDFDKSVLEYKDVFRLRPVMPKPTNIDPASLQRAFQQENEAHKELDWELEDLLPTSFQIAFHEEHPSAQIKAVTKNGHCHREYTRDGKAKFHRFIKAHAVIADLERVCAVLRCMRHYLSLKPF